MAAEPLTEREVLIALAAFKAAMNAVLNMIECGFEPITVCRNALRDKEAERRVRETLERNLEMIDREAKRRAD